jgi:hypothetical protein
MEKPDVEVREEWLSRKRQAWRVPFFSLVPGVWASREKGKKGTYTQVWKP